MKTVTKVFTEVEVETECADMNYAVVSLRNPNFPAYVVDRIIALFPSKHDAEWYVRETIKHYTDKEGKFEVRKVVK